MASEVRIVARLSVEALISCVAPANHSTRGSTLAEFALFLRILQHTSSMMLFNGNANVGKEVFELFLVLTLHDLVVFNVMLAQRALEDGAPSCCFTLRFVDRKLLFFMHWL